MIIVYRKGDIRNQIVAWGADKERRLEGNLPSHIAGVNLTYVDRTRRHLTCDGSSRSS